MVHVASRGARIPVVVALIAGLSAVVSVDVAGAATPTVTVTPSTVGDSGTSRSAWRASQVEDDLVAAGLCQKAYAEGADFSRPLDHCVLLHVGTGGAFEVPDLRINDTNSTRAEGMWACSDLPDGCVIAGWTATAADPLHGQELHRGADHGAAEPFGDVVRLDGGRPQ